MLKKFVLLAAISFALALTVAMLASYLIQTHDANISTDEELNIILDDVAVLMDENAQEIKNIRAEMDGVYLDKTRAFAEMVRLKPEIIENYDELCRIRDLMAVDELHICDAEGVLRWGTVKDFYGFNFADGDQTRPILAALDDPGFELAQDPQISGTGFYFQYISVSRYDEKGIIQIGMHPTRLEEALQKAAPENILNQIKIDKSIRIMIISGDTILGDSYGDRTGKTLTGSGAENISAGTGSTEVDGAGYYVARQIGDYLVATVISKSYMYQTRNTMLVVFLITNAIILFVLIFVIGIWIVKRVISPLEMVGRDISVIKGGDLERRVNVRFTPEFTALSNGINAMVDSIKKMLNNAENMTKTLRSVMESVEASAENVNMTTRELFVESGHLTDGALAQNQAVEKMSSLLGEVYEKTNANAEHASAAGKASHVALLNADDGSKKMVDMVSAVEEINNASQDISKVIKTIDDIAFPTNILALNAAVEAARAGTHGRGFAVVSEEVRNLAAKSAEAAKQTETLITSSMQRAQAGVRIANETAEKIGEVVENIRESATLMEGIVTSSQEQAAAVGQLNDNMELIRKGVETTGLSAGRITGESEKLQANSREMSESLHKLSAPEERLELTGNV